jgi:hypothetical protein
MANFSDFQMQMPASSSFWEVKFKSTSVPNTITTKNNGNLMPASSVIFDVGQIQYEEVEVFVDKLYYIKNVANFNKITIDYIEDEALTITKFHKNWIFHKENPVNKSFLHRSSTPNIYKDFSETILIKKYASDFKTVVLELEAVIIPDASIAFTFDWDDSVMTKTFTYQILKVKKFEMYGKLGESAQQAQL